MSTIVLVRPGCTDFDEQSRVQGVLDLPLNKRGEEQVRQLVLELSTINIEILYTSPCEPARETALAIGQALDLPVKELESLKNLDQGLWQGLQLEELRRKHPRVFRQWEEAPESVCAPEGELVCEALGRIRKSLEKPLKRGISFAIVAPEPLASIIDAVVTGEKLDLSHSMCNPVAGQHWEFLRLNGQTPIPATVTAGAETQFSGQLPHPPNHGAAGLRN